LAAVRVEQLIAPPPRQPVTDRLNSRRLLHGLIRQYFNTAELKGLCFDLAIEYEDLADGGRDSYITSLLLYCFRQGEKETGRLLERLEQLRPEVVWPELGQLVS
jgi:hypothetical protein